MSRRKNVSLRLIPAGPGLFRVSATSRNPRFPFTDNPIGRVALNPDGSWSYSGGANPGAGPIYGNLRTKERAAMECYRAHRSWVGY